MCSGAEQLRVTIYDYCSLSFLVIDLELSLKVRDLEIELKNLVGLDSGSKVQDAKIELEVLDDYEIIDLFFDLIA